MDNSIEEHTTELRSWGRWKKIRSKQYFIIDIKEIRLLIDKKYIPIGNCRSYGDCVLATNTVCTTTKQTILSLDTDLGIITTESGALLSEIIEKIVPQKWFLPVTPGTKYITVGGAVAADVHGKNHHHSGSFSDHIITLVLVTPDGTKYTCSETENVALFRATCGGMGLTGVITQVTFRLQRLKSAFIDQHTQATVNLRDTFDAFEKYKNTTYVVAWLDGFAKGKNLGKGLLFSGIHSQDQDFNTKKLKRKTIPEWFPSFILNPWSIRLYNIWYYKKNVQTSGRVSLDTFFYPLDRLKSWNRLYGKKGLIQYQVVIPLEYGYSGVLEVMEVIRASIHAPYLTVLKKLGKENENYLSFPLQGYTLAVDFKIKKGIWELLDDLDDIVGAYKGRAYLAKDGRMSREFFEKGYPKLSSFKKVRAQYQLINLESLQSKRLGL